jgi:hypothetical protein
MRSAVRLFRGSVKTTGLAGLCLTGVVCSAAAAGASLALAAASGSPSAAILTVSTTADIVNGDVSSPAALIARPGSDGISLREVITAADHASGYEAITFAPPLAGRTITPTTFLPAFTRDNTALIGSTTADGQPAVTLDAGKNTNGCCAGLLGVQASDVTISHLRIVGVHVDEIAIAVRAGAPGGELAVHDVRIESNVLDNSGVSDLGVGVGIGTDFPGNLKRTGSPTYVYPGATGASLSDITVANNVIRGFNDDGINVQLAGTNCSVSGLLIADNAFADINVGDAGSEGSPAVELDNTFSGNNIVGTRILRNTFTGAGSWAGIALNGGVGHANSTEGTPIPASGNVISGTVISQNRFDGNQQAIVFNAGAGAANATGNTVLNTEISNDVFARNAPYGAIGIGGGLQGATGNRVDGVAIVNDTIAFNDGAVGFNGASGNQITNVDAQNTIFWSNGRDIGGSPADAAAANPTIRASLMGIDPRFVSAQDFHLQPGSPATDAGTSNGAPTFDFENRARVGAPDIGAYEFGGAPRPRLDVLLEELGGTGTVTSSPAGIACERTCAAAFDSNAAVTLTAAPVPGSRFAGWSGPCSGTGACTLTLAAAARVTATFSPAAAKPARKLAPKCKKGQKSSAKHPCRHG